MQRPLINLASDLVLLIGTYLPLADLKNLRLTCTTLGALFVGGVLKDVKVFNNIEKIEEDAHDFRRISAGDGNLAQFAVSLTIGPAQDRKPVVLPLAKEKLATVAEDVFASLIACQNVRRVVWQPFCKEYVDINHAIVKALNSLPRLCELETTGSVFELGNLELNRFLSLESLSMARITFNTQTLQKLSEFVASSRSLFSIKLDNMHNWGRDGIWAYYGLHFNELLAGCSSHLPLHRLDLQGFVFRFDSKATPYLKSLSSLTIISAWNYSSEAPQSSSESSVRHSFAELWRSLEAAKVCLQELEVNLVSDPLITYLSSFKGLRKLRLRVQAFDSDAEADEAALAFFSRAFPHHTSTLQDLSITPVFEGKWCFGPDSLQDITKCPNLKRLQVMINCAILTRLERTQSVKLPEDDVLKQLFDLVITHHPSLGLLVVDSTAPAWDRGSFCGTSAEQYEMDCEEQMQGVTQIYQAPLGTRYLPDLEVAKVTYHAKRSQHEAGGPFNTPPWRTRNVLNSHCKGYYFFEKDT